MKLRGERLVAGQPLARRLAEMRLGVVEEFLRPHFLVRADALAEPVAVLGQ